MTELQSQLFDLLRSELAESEHGALVANIKTLNAAELRHNIKVFRDTE